MADTATLDELRQIAFQPTSDTATLDELRAIAAKPDTATIDELKQIAAAPDLAPDLRMRQIMSGAVDALAGAPNATVQPYLAGSGRLTDRPTAGAFVPGTERLTDTNAGFQAPTILQRIGGGIGTAASGLAVPLLEGASAAGRGIVNVADYLAPGVVANLREAGAKLGRVAEKAGVVRAGLEQAPPANDLLGQIANVGGRALAFDVQAAAALGSVAVQPEALAQAVLFNGIGKFLNAGQKAEALATTLKQSPVTQAVAGNLGIPTGGAEALGTAITRSLPQTIPTEIERSFFNPQKGMFQAEAHAALDGAAERLGQTPEQVIHELPIVPPNPTLAMNVVPDEIAATLSPDDRHLFNFVTQPISSVTLSERLKVGGFLPDVRQFFASHLSGFARQGPAGEELAHGFQKAEMNADTIAGQWRAAAKQRELWATMDETQLRQARFLVRGDVAAAEALGPITPEVTKAAQGWTKGIATPAAKMAQDLGLTIKDAKTGLEEPWLADPGYYFPKMYDAEKVKADMPHLAKWMTDTKQADSIESAKEMLAAQWARFPERRMGNLETKLRLNLPEQYEVSPLVAMEKYIEGASNRIGYAQVLGVKDQEVKRLLDVIGSTGKDITQVSNSANLLLGTYRDLGVLGAAFDSAGMRKTIGLMRNVSVLGKMSLSILAQFPEFAASAARSTLHDMTGGVLTAFGKTGTNFNEAAGILGIKLSNATLRGLQLDEAPLSGAVRTFLGPFVSIDQWNKRAFGIAAKSQIERLAKDYAATGNERAARALRQYGINPELAVRLEGNLPEVIVQRGALKGLKDMALGSSAVRGTPFLDAPEFKAVSLFKGWATRYAGFMGDFVWKEWEAGNPRPLATAVLGGMAIGYPALKLRDVVSGRKAPDENLKQLARVFFYSNGIGIMSDALLASSDKNQLVQLAVGPVVMDVAEGLTAISKSATGMTPRPIGKFLARRAPVVGYRLNQALTPKPQQSIEQLMGGTATP